MSRKKLGVKLVDVVFDELRDWKFFRYALDGLTDEDEDEMRECMANALLAALKEEKK